MPPETFPMSVFRLAATLALFVTLAIVAELPGSTQVDHAITIWIQRAAPAPDAPAAALASLGDPEVIIGLAVLGFVLLLFRDKDHGRAFVWLAAGSVGASLMTVILQHVIVHVGPPLTLTRPIQERGLVFLRDPAIVPGFAAAGLLLLLLRDKRHGRTFVWLAAGVIGITLVTVIIYHAILRYHVILRFEMRFLKMVWLYAPYGFPSGHMVRTTLLAGIGFRRVPALAVAIVAGMGGSLVYLGFHWMSEVLGGVCIGWACVEIGRGVWKRLA